ncbi:nitroreductase family protein [Mycoplasma zalophi]|uniref:nitroreductase family protein n=1 Tax=Mycoplasma zalophi TaxID=191287 RepID=UPI001C114405|nr:nitroreductase family protein [Mycoplasma zalophi]MBU4691120.1 nitroreductase family protein [Mycoplasma zalophi]
MTFSEKIKNRYSVRDFDPNKKLTEDEEKQILDAIASAPTSSNWHSSSAIVVKDQVVLNRLSKIHPKAKQLENCGMLIVFLADYNRMNIALKEFPEYKYNSHDSETYTVAVGDAFIQATTAQAMAIELGLGTCFLGLVRVGVNEIIDALNIKGQAFPVIGLSIGHKKSEGLVKPKLNRIYKEKYNIEQINDEVAKYNVVLKDFFAKYAQNTTTPLTYTEAMAKIASGYNMNSKEIEEIWGLELKK